MAKRETKDKVMKKLPPVTTTEARETQLIALAMDLVEQRLIDGTASSQETTHFLKLATSESRIKKRILQEEEKLIKAKTEALQSQQRIEELYAKAMSAMASYSGSNPVEDISDEDV